MLDQKTKDQLAQIANTIRVLSIDGVQAANSGHPGMPMGCAEIGAVLLGSVLKLSPHNPSFLNRDHLILSAGHGSMWIYSCLHLAGYDLSIDELKRFRQWHSKTPGHPEFGHTEGVEATTGPLGQGISQAVGHAFGLKILGGRFDKLKTLLNNKVYAVCGDGCIMEGISAEAASFAGHMQLNNLVVLYDYNHITLDGKWSESCSEDVEMRFKGHGWDVYKVNGNDIQQLHTLLTETIKDQKKPILVIAETIIGQGSPNKAGTHKVHGAPLGPEEVKNTKIALGFPGDESFHVPESVKDFFAKKRESWLKESTEWQTQLDQWIASSDEGKEFKKMFDPICPSFVESQMENLVIPAMEGRNASNAVINFLAKLLPNFYGGSADLSCSDMTRIHHEVDLKGGEFKGRNIRFGIREFAMASISSGLAQMGCFFPFCGTFLTFSDYMRNAVRLAALMKLHQVYQFTHDSFYVGEDGPTHQPIEHVCSLRAIPDLQVIRLGDQNEVKTAWLAAIDYKGPTAIILSRQKLNEVPGTKVPYKKGLNKGAYIVHKSADCPDVVLLATGSELSLAYETAQKLEQVGKTTRVVSFPCWELFDRQPCSYKHQILGNHKGLVVSIEAGTSMGWHKYIGQHGLAISIDHFGASAPPKELAKHYGFTPEAVFEKICKKMGCCGSSCSNKSC